MGDTAEADGASCLEVERCQHRGWGAPQGCTHGHPSGKGCRDGGMQDEAGHSSIREYRPHSPGESRA